MRAVKNDFKNEALQLQEATKGKRQEIREARELEIQESAKKIEKQRQARMDARKAVVDFLNSCSDEQLQEMEDKFTSETPYQISDIEFFHDWVAERENLGNPYPPKRIQRKAIIVDLESN